MNQAQRIQQGLARQRAQATRARTCPKCGRTYTGVDTPAQHHPLCPIAQLAKKTPDGLHFATH